jgi:hypothetical protein
MSIAAPQIPVDAAREPRYLSGPVSDFLMLGGMTLLIFPVLLALPSDSFEGPIGAFAFWLAFAINHPHFAVSYRIFYQGFGGKVSGVDHADATLRYRYMVAGIAAPLLLGVGLLAVAVTASSDVLSYGFNLMGFFVGWHYVKQGYGMAMVDAALKQRYLPDFDKKVLLVNGYAVWGFTWARANNTSEPIEFAGLTVSRLNVPSAVAWVLGAVAIASTLTLVYTFGRRALLRAPTAWIGIASYIVSLYLWMVLVRANPLFILLTPALHSLQYLWVVRTFQTNRHAADPTKRSWKSQYWRSVLLGAGMFFIFPIILDVSVPLEAERWGSVPFLFISLIFINVHHYFLDNVMWRRGNAEVSQHLFA